MPAEYGARLPAVGALPGAFRDLVLRWRDTVAGEHALRVYRDERRAPPPS